MPGRDHRWWLLGLFCLVSGCAHATPPPCVFASPELPTVIPSSFPLELSALPVDPTLVSGETPYQGLTEAECPWFAARASTLGNLLDQKAQTTCQKCLKASEQACVVQQLSAEEARNRAAGDALEAFYRLIEAEGRRALLLLALQEVNDSLLRAQELETKGFAPPVETGTIQKKLADLRSDDANLRITLLQLNARLKVLLGLSSGEYSLWPLADLKIVPDEIDIDQAVAEGLSRRQDLALLGTVTYCLDKHSLPVAKQVLASISPLLAEPSGCLAALAACFDHSQVESVRQQLLILLTDRQRQATEEIRQAVGVVGYRVQLALLSRQKVETAERRIKELEEKRDKGIDAEEDLSTARLDLYEAQGNLLREVVNWKIARAQLRQAQGRLLEESPSIDNTPPRPTPTESAP